MPEISDIDVEGTYLSAFKDYTVKVSFPSNIKKILMRFINSQKPVYLNRTLKFNRQQELKESITKEINNWLGSETIGHDMKDFMHNSDEIERVIYDITVHNFTDLFKDLLEVIEDMDSRIKSYEQKEFEIDEKKKIKSKQDDIGIIKSNLSGIKWN